MASYGPSQCEFTFQALSGLEPAGAAQHAHHHPAVVVAPAILH